MMTPIWQWTVRALLAANLFVALHGLQAQQLDYNRSALIHGFGSRKEMWTTARPELSNQSPQQYLAQRVDLSLLWLPNWDSTAVFDTQWQQLRDSIAIHAGRHVLVAHSTGGLVSRYAYLNGGQTTRDATAAILTIASPHQGAILADSAQQLGQFVHDLKRSVEGASSALKITLVGLISVAVGGIAGLMALLFLNFPSITEPSQLLAVGTLSALRTNSAQVQTLNGSGNFDASIPRANIVAKLDNNKFMPLKLAAAFANISEQQQIDQFQKARSTFNVCKSVMAFTIVGIPAAVKCSDAERMMGRLDETWQRYASGSSPQQFCGQVWTLDGPVQKCWIVMMPRLNLPTDGVVPNERSVYPSQGAGPFAQPQPVSANHMTVYRIPAGANEMANMMLDHFGMRPPPPPPPPPPPGFSANIIGNSSISPFQGCSWYVSVSAGSAPYSYAWTVNGQSAGGNSESLDHTNGGSSFTIEVAVTDQNQATITASFFVNVEEGYYCS